MKQTNELVERITREVLHRLSPVSRHKDAPATGQTHERVLVILTGGESLVSESLEALRDLCQSGARITLILSHAVSRKLTHKEIQRFISPEKIISGDLQECYERSFLDSFNRLVVPLLSINTASQVSQYLSLRVPAHLILTALIAGIPVLASDDAMLPDGVNHPAAKKKKEEIKNALSGMGIRWSRIQDMLSKPGAVPEAKISTPLSSGLEAMRAAGADRVGTTGESISDIKKGIACMIDHTLLKPASKEADVIKLCAEARKYLYASVCVNPGYVALAARELHGSPVKVCTVVGFPLGATTTMTKVNETRDAIANGAREIDMVINIGELKSGRDDVVLRDIQEVVKAANGNLVKVILETALLSNEEKVRACLLCKQAGADFVKTSTGFSSGGATVEDIQLMRQTVGPDMGVKASGGIRNLETAMAMKNAGATRIGASASIAITGGCACPTR